MLRDSSEHMCRYAASSHRSEGDSGHYRDWNPFKLFGKCCMQDQCHGEAYIIDMVSIYIVDDLTNFLIWWKCA